jgi:hypothetical protein
MLYLAVLAIERIDIQARNSGHFEMWHLPDPDLISRREAANQAYSHKATYSRQPVEDFPALPAGQRHRNLA